MKATNLKLSKDLVSILAYAKKIGFVGAISQVEYDAEGGVYFNLSKRRFYCDKMGEIHPIFSESEIAKLLVNELG